MIEDHLIMAASETPKISVVIYSYNFEKYLKECIESILAQTLRPYEILICDDHSADKSWNIICKYRKNYPSLIRTYRHNTNIGMIANGNFGFKKIKGELISWLDGDDRWLPKKLELEWRALEKNPSAKIAYSNVCVINTYGQRTQMWDDGKKPAPPSGDAFVQVFSKKFFPNSTSVFRNHLMYRSLFDDIGYLDEHLEIFIDWDFKIRATSRYPIEYSQQALIEYRIHDKGIHNISHLKRFKDILATYKKNIPLLEERSVDEQKVIKKGIKRKLNSLMPEPLEEFKFSDEEMKLLESLDISKADFGHLVANNLSAKKKDTTDIGFEIAINEDAHEINELGENLYNNGKLETAKNAFLKVINLNPHFTDAYNNLGVCYWNEQHCEKALMYFRKAIEIDPNYSSAVFNLASIYTDSGNIFEAKKVIMSYLKRNPQNQYFVELFEKISVLSKSHSKPFEKNENDNVDPFIINSLPKSGTHLLSKALELFPGISSSGVWVEHAKSKKYKTDEGFNSVKIPIGIDWPQKVNLSEIENELQQIRPGQFLTGHIPYSQELSETIKKIGIKTFLILRDPRDVVVSHAKYVAREQNHFLYEQYQQLNEAERILRSIIGIGRHNSSKTKLLSINERFQSVLAWMNEPHNCTIFFEKLVGAKGAGSDEKQTEELKRISEHLKIPCSEDNIENIKANLFGGTRTFEKGVIGRWRESFNNIHKDVFKDVAGKLLVDLDFENDFNW